jgi:hypothetical protein
MLFELGLSATWTLSLVLPNRSVDLVEIANLKEGLAAGCGPGGQCSLHRLTVRELRREEDSLVITLVWSG